MSAGLEEQIMGGAVQAVGLAGTLLVGFTILALLLDRRQGLDGKKWFLFLGMVLPVILATLYLAGSTVYLNTISESGGPVHWHTDFEIWNCGQHVDLVEPIGLSNRVGTSVLHEHGDQRVHVEGVVVDSATVGLDDFFAAVGGVLGKGTLVVPTDAGLVAMKDGESCNGGPGLVQVFLYRVNNPGAKPWVYTQQKLPSIENYVPAPYSNVPPGDCVIIEFDIDKPATDKLCTSYEVVIERGELRGG